MAIIKCKMCGGSLQISEDSSVCECEYCGTRQTVPKADDEKKLKLFDRAGRLLRGCEFDKAAGVFESIVADFPEEAEAYWGLVLCKYGIEYVDDPSTGKKIPTCHRSSFDNVMKDPNFEQACENADAIARRVYRDEARAIEELRQAILQVSGREEPYDVFISYKETDGEGQRTLDSVIAQDIYRELTREGYRVFFSRISLENRLGTEYEPYIFAALNSARVMIVVGTDYEHFDAVWVKNEWSRYLKLIAKGEKKTLIPVFRDMDAYDMPEAFNNITALDMGKLGALQDLVHGVEKILGKKQAEPGPAQQVIQQVIQGGGPNVTALLQRGNMALEDREWDKAKEFFDQVLNIDAKCGAAYLGLGMVEEKARDRSVYAAAYTKEGSSLRDSRYAARARQFDPELEKWFAELDEQGRKAEERARIAAEKAEAARKAAVVRLAPIRQRNAPAGKMISAGLSYTVGLRADGTVVTAGDNSKGQCNVSGWTDMMAVSAGANHTVGLRADGTVLAVGSNLYGQRGVSGWTDIVAVSAGYSHTVGLRSNGKVVTVGDNSKGQCDVSGWTDIVAVSAGGYHTVGLRADGTVVAVGDNSKGQCNVGGWTDIVAISAGLSHTVGLRADGTVVAVGSNLYGQRRVSDWTDIVAISAGWSHTVGLRSDGTVVAAGLNNHGQCDVSGWKMFNSIDTIEAEQKDAAEKAEAERRAAEERARIAAEKAEAARKVKVAALNKEKAGLQTELANLKGLFTGKRRKEIEGRLAEIEAELKTLG
jgi:alpha-tubulin suppressor-like RCC1 family protein